MVIANRICRADPAVQKGEAEHTLGNGKMMPYICLVSVVALTVFLIVRQYRMHKKQMLFDRRLQVFLLVSELWTHYEKHRELLERNRGSGFDLGVIGDFRCLTEPACLVEIRSVMDEPLSGEEYAQFLQKMKELEEQAGEAKLVFPRQISEPICGMITAYRTTLQWMVDYQRFLCRKSLELASRGGSGQVAEATILYCYEGAPRREVFSSLSDLRDAAERMRDHHIQLRAAKMTRLSKNGIPDL